jgi:hypothetical protein
MGIFSYVKAGKKAFEIVKPKIAKNLKQKFDAKQKLFKGVDEKGSNLSTVQKGKFKKEGSQEIDRIFKKYEKKAKGGRAGYKGGKLVGKQKNLDVAAPFGKITGADFKKLRNK